MWWSWWKCAVSISDTGSTAPTRTIVTAVGSTQARVALYRRHQAATATAKLFCGGEGGFWGKLLAVSKRKRGSGYKAHYSVLLVYRGRAALCCENNASFTRLRALRACLFAQSSAFAVASTASPSSSRYNVHSVLPFVLLSISRLSHFNIATGRDGRLPGHRSGRLV